MSIAALNFDRHFDVNVKGGPRHMQKAFLACRRGRALCDGLELVHAAPRRLPNS
jgi:hypothetical protein